MARFDPADLTAFATSLVEALGTDPAVAATVADSLVQADLRGHGSHGIRRLAEFYPAMVEAGDILPDAEPDIERLGPTMAAIDGNRGWGHRTGRVAADLAVELTADAGVGVVGVRNGAHMGRIGEFAEIGAERDVILLAFVNTGGTAPMAAAPGTTSRNVSVNPFVAGIPTFDALPFPIVLDAATGQVAHGKVMKRAVAGKPIPEGWAIDDDGTALRDADAFEAGEGAIFPLGGRAFGYKGTGLSLVLELVTGMVGGARVHGQPEESLVNNGAAMVAIDPTRFLDREACHERVAALAAHLRGLDYDPDLVPGPGATGEHVLLPGEPEYQTRTKRERDGIPLDRGAIRFLDDAAAALDVKDRLAALEPSDG